MPQYTLTAKIQEDLHFVFTTEAELREAVAALREGASIDPHEIGGGCACAGNEAEWKARIDDETIADSWDCDEDDA